jgi:hypothetical protein
MLFFEDILNFVFYVIANYINFIADNAFIILMALSVICLTYMVMFRTKYFDIDEINRNNPPK